MTSDALWAALAERIDEQIKGRPDYAEIVACLSDPDCHEIGSVFNRDDSGGLDILTLAFRAKVAVPDGWLTVATVSWRDLPVTLEQLRAQHAWAVLQADSAP